MSFQVHESSLPGVCILAPQVFSDERGLFAETWNDKDFKALGFGDVFVQDNLSRSAHGVLRGLHFQIHSPQAQVVNVIHGEIFDVVVDLRRGSPTYRQWCSFELSSAKPKLLYMPPGCAHGFCVLSEQADIYYKVTQFYSPGDEGGIAWNDPDMNIPWPCSSPHVSHRDAAYPSLRDIPTDKRPHTVFTPTSGARPA